MSASNDSADLEALFDSIATDYQPAPAPAPEPAPAASPAPDIPGVGDNDELQALFDSVAAEAEPEPPASAASSAACAGGSAGEGADDAWPQQEEVFRRVGHMARSLHDTLSQLGYDKLIEKTVSTLPDAKDRLAYVANLTEQAACRVLNATDIALPLVDQTQTQAQRLAERWDKVFANQLPVAEFRQLALDSRQFLGQELPQKTSATHAQLTEIMMAQDFQDLTGQVIKKIVVLAQELESGLMNLLLDVVPEARKTEQVTSLMNGPVVNAEGRTDVVVNQAQVDDLLDSLGF